jgi:uncharacterized protein
MSHAAELRILYDDVAARVRTISVERPWPCRKGCASCCERLAAAPQFTEPEWHILQTGLASLTSEIWREVAQRIESLPDRAPIVCPLLDRASQSCLVYEHRPAACRMYGFYVERDRGLYCAQIEEGIEAGEYEGVTWGNACGMDARLTAFGASRDLREWFSRSTD